MYLNPIKLLLLTIIIEIGLDFIKGLWQAITLSKLFLKYILSMVSMYASAYENNTELFVLTKMKGLYVAL